MELVAVDEIAAQGFGIVGFVADVGEDEYAGFVHDEFRKRRSNEESHEAQMDGSSIVCLLEND